MSDTEDFPHMAKKPRYTVSPSCSGIKTDIDVNEAAANADMRFVGNDIDMDEVQKLKEFQVLDEVNSNDEESDYDNTSTSEDESETVPDDEIEQMLEEDLPEGFKTSPNPKVKPYITIEKTVLEEKGVNQFESLPLDWMMVRHYSGMPVYLHKTSRVCTLAKPYFLGKGSARRHDIPLSAIPCLNYRRGLEEEEKQKGIDKEIAEQIRNCTWGQPLHYLGDGEYNDNPSNVEIVHINDDNLNNVEMVNSNDDNPNNVESVNVNNPNNVETANINDLNPNNVETANVNDDNPNNVETANVNDDNPNNVETANVNDLNPNNVETANVNDDNPNNVEMVNSNDDNPNNLESVNVNNPNNVETANVNDDNLNNIETANVNDDNLNNIETANVNDDNPNNVELVNVNNLNNVETANINDFNTNNVETANVNDDNLNNVDTANVNEDNPNNVETANINDLNPNNVETVNDITIKADVDITTNNSLDIENNETSSNTIGSSMKINKANARKICPFIFEEDVTNNEQSNKNCMEYNIKIEEDSMSNEEGNCELNINADIHFGKQTSNEDGSGRQGSYEDERNNERMSNNNRSNEQSSNEDSRNNEQMSNENGNNEDNTVNNVQSEAPLRSAKRQPVILPGGLVMPPPRVEAVNNNWKTQHLTYEEVNQYCKKLFHFKTINIMRFQRWADRRKHAKMRKTLQYPALPGGTKLITLAALPNQTGMGNKATKRDWVMNMNGSSYLSVFHEYVRRTLQKQPTYEFQQLENAATPYQATVYIGGMQYGVGHGSSKRHAKAAAAKASIEILIPEMKDDTPGDEMEPDLSFFDCVGIEDPRVAEFCHATCEPSPHAILATCLLRNFGTGDRHIDIETSKLEYEKIKLTMKVGKHVATIVAKNKKIAKQRASQAILQALHPHVRSWGSLLRLYGSRSVKTCKEKRMEEQQITLLQGHATHNQPNEAVLGKLREEMRRLQARDASIAPIGTLLLPQVSLPSHSNAGLDDVNLSPSHSPARSPTHPSHTRTVHPCT